MGLATDILGRYAPLIDDWDAFAAACGRPLPAVVWANPLRFEMLARLNRAAGHPVETGDGERGRAAAAGRMLAARLEARGNGCEPLAWLPGAMKVFGMAKPGNTLEHYLGIYHVQEEASLLPPQVLAPAAGERILDLCAAPGGKTAQLSVAAGPGATIVANDVRIDRLRALRSNCERLGLLNVAMTAHDGTCFPLAAGLFDAILLDAPCSCEGNVRDMIGGGNEVTGEFLTGRSGLQATLLGRAWKLLAPGGRLVYATCTFAPEENEMVLDYSLKDDASIEPIAIPGLRAGAGVTEWRGTKLRRDCANVARFWPHLNDTGGFTVALVRKASH